MCASGLPMGSWVRGPAAVWRWVIVWVSLCLGRRGRWVFVMTLGLVRTSSVSRPTLLARKLRHKVICPRSHSQ